MTTRINTLRPGLLVSLSSRIKGNCTYKTNDIEADHIDYDGTRRARWETERTVSDPAEYEAAVKVRCDARNLVTRVCSTSAHGLLCLTSNRDKLISAIEQARELADNFNRTASQTTVQVTCIVGEIAQDDVEATRAINSEISDLLSQMERGIKRLDVASVRDAAKRAKALSDICTPAANERLQTAIDTARDAARKLVKHGEQAAEELNVEAMRAITEARLTFLDVDSQPLAVELPGTPANNRAIDFEPEARDYAPTSRDMPALDF